MRIGKISFLIITLYFILSPFLFLIFPKISRDSMDYLIIFLFTFLFYLVILFGFSQIFHFKENELVIWYFNPFKKNVSISYKSITNVEIFRGLSLFVINVFHFKTTTGEIIINNNVFSMHELKKIKEYFASIDIECEI